MTRRLGEPLHSKSEVRRVAQQTDQMSCPKCGGDFKVVDVQDRESGHKGFALECSVCKYMDFDVSKYVVHREVE